MKKNQGFSLVELIVVIAIMAILVGVLAPAYLRYVEKSRKSTDVSAIDEMMGAAEKVAVDPQLTVPKNSTFTIQLGNTVQCNYSAASGGDEDDSDSDVQAEWRKIANATNGYTIKSSDWQGATGSFEGKVSPDGDVQWTYTGTTATAMVEFSKSLKAKVTAGAEE